MRERSGGNNQTSKINVFDPLVEKKIYFTRLIVPRALLGHQTSQLQNQFLFCLVAQYTIIVH